MNKILLYIFLFVSLNNNAFAQLSTDNRTFKKEVYRLFDTKDFVTTKLSDRSLTQGSLYSLYNNNKLIGYAYIGRVNTCLTGGCKPSTSSGNFEYFDYFILFDRYKTIGKVKVVNYQATHGHEVCSRNWLSQFKGYKGKNILTPGENIDGISGATKSVNSITRSINDVYKKLIELTNK